mgnify:CR=1 FL=1
MNIPDLVIGNHGFINNRIRVNTLHQVRISFRNAFVEKVELTASGFYNWEEPEEGDYVGSGDDIEVYKWIGKTPLGDRMVLKRKKEEHDE